MTAPTIQKGTRCGCRCSSTHPIVTPIDLGGQCEVDAVRTVARYETWGGLDAAQYEGSLVKTVHTPMCYRCAEYHDRMVAARFALPGVDLTPGKVNTDAEWAEFNRAAWDWK